MVHCVPAGNVEGPMTGRRSSLDGMAPHSLFPTIPDFPLAPVGFIHFYFHCSFALLTHWLVRLVCLLVSYWYIYLYTLPPTMTMTTITLRIVPAVVIGFVILFTTAASAFSITQSSSSRFMGQRMKLVQKPSPSRQTKPSALTTMFLGSDGGLLGVGAPEVVRITKTSLSNPFLDTSTLTHPITNTTIIITTTIMIGYNSSRGIFHSRSFRFV